MSSPNPSRGAYDPKDPVLWEQIVSGCPEQSVSLHSSLIEWLPALLSVPPDPDYAHLMNNPNQDVLPVVS
jgi:hypothetical protein